MKKFIIALGGLFVLLGGLAFYFNAQNNQDVYSLYGLDGLTPEEMTESLDRQILDRNIIIAGIRGYQLEINTEDGQTVYPIDDELFYLSFAPYVDNTHPCGIHNLTTCRSELVFTDLDVTIVDSEGVTIFDETVTTYENGFKGVWLPRGIEATITVHYDGMTASAPIATYDDSDTCLTTPLQLK